MKAFATYLKQQHGGLMTVGKHAGKFFDELMKEDPDCSWTGYYAGRSGVGVHIKTKLAELASRRMWSTILFMDRSTPFGSKA